MFCYIAYRYIPLKTDDLYRYYLLIDKIRDKPIDWALQSSAYRYEPFSNFLYIFIAKITDNNAMYQVIAIILIYGTFYLNLKKITNFTMKKEENLYFVTFFSFVVLLFSISGTRNTLAALFFASGLYNETDSITKRSWILYILSVCTHIALFPIVLMRFLCVYLPKKKFYLVHLILFLWPLTITVFLGLMSEIQVLYIQVIVRKIQYYTYNMYDQKLDSRYFVAMLLLCVLVSLMYFVNSNSRDTYTNFMGYLIAFTLGCFGSPVIFERYVRVLCACMLPMFIGLRKEKRKIKNFIMYSIAVLDVGMLSYQVWMFISHFNSWFIN